MMVLLAHVHAMAAHRPPGYVEDVLASGTVEGDHITIPDDAYAALVEKYTTKPSVQTEPCYAPGLNDPTIVELAENFTGAVSEWVKAGAPVVSEAAYERRAVECEGDDVRCPCPHWQPDAYLGMGRCGHVECGCTRFKRWLATARCPLGRWPA